MMRKHGVLLRTQRVWLGVAAVAVIAVLTGCSGSQRSTSAFCNELHAGKERIAGRLNEANDQIASADDETEAEALGGGLMTLLASGSDLRAFTHDLAEVAPDAIHREMEDIATFADQVFDQSGSASGDPMGVAANLFVDSIRINSSLERVDSFAERNCGEGI